MVGPYLNREAFTSRNATEGKVRIGWLVNEKEFMTLTLKLDHRLNGIICFAFLSSETSLFQ